LVTEVDIQLNKGAQADFVHSEADFPAFMGGQGSGKTAAGVIKAWMFTIQYPGSRGVWTEPVAAMFAESLLPALRELADEDGNKYFGDYEGGFWQEQGKGGPNHRIEFSNGCLWMLKAAETPERLVGFEVAWVLMNEAGSTEHGSQEQAYLNLVGRLRQKGFPHWLGVATTPAGYNWLYREWVDNPKLGHVLFTGSTFENKKNLPDDYIERMSREYVEGTPMYDERVLGKFVQMSGLVVPGFDANIHACVNWPLDELFTHKVAGVDFAPQSPTTVIEVAMTASNHIWIREWLYERECDDETFIKACRDAMDSGVTAFACDPSGKDNIEFLSSNGIPAFKAESNSRTRRAKIWTSAFATGCLSIDREAGFTIRELGGLAWKERRGRELDTNDWTGPDHAFDGGAYGLMLLKLAVPRGFKLPELVINI
jgi:phage terminase large subunit